MLHTKRIHDGLFTTHVLHGIQLTKVFTHAFLFEFLAPCPATCFAKRITHDGQRLAMIRTNSELHQQYDSREQYERSRKGKQSCRQFIECRRAILHM